MKNAIHFLCHKVTTDTFDAKLAQVACFVVGALVLMLSFWKLLRLELSEAQLFFGVLLSLCAPLLFVVVGLLLPVTIGANKSRE